MKIATSLVRHGWVPRRPCDSCSDTHGLFFASGQGHPTAVVAEVLSRIEEKPQDDRLSVPENHYNGSIYNNGTCSGSNGHVAGGGLFVCAERAHPQGRSTRRPSHWHIP